MAKENNCKRHTLRAEEQKKSLINRLSRIEGQIRGLKVMIENDRYCPEILTQSAAAGAALQAFNRELLSAHIHSCVVEDIKAGDENTVDELIEIIKKISK